MSPALNTDPNPNSKMNTVHRVFKTYTDYSGWQKVASSLMIGSLSVFMWLLVFVTFESWVIHTISVILALIVSHTIVFAVANIGDLVRFYLKSNLDTFTQYTVVERLGGSETRAKMPTVDEPLQIHTLIIHLITVYISRQPSVTYLSATIDTDTFVKNVVYVNVLVNRDFVRLQYELEDLFVRPSETTSTEYIDQLATGNAYMNCSCYACGTEDTTGRKGFAEPIDPIYSTSEIELCGSCLQSIATQIPEAVRTDAQAHAVVTNL